MSSPPSPTLSHDQEPEQEQEQEQENTSNPPKSNEEQTGVGSDLEESGKKNRSKKRRLENHSVQPKAGNCSKKFRGDFDFFDRIIDDEDFVPPGKMTMWFRQYCKEKEKQKRTKKREKRNQREMIGSGTSDNGTSEGETSGWDTSEEETNAEPANQMESTSMVESSSRENVALETAANRPPKPWSPLPSKLIIYVNVRSDEYLALFLSSWSADQFRSRLEDSLNEPSTHIRNIYVRGPMGIKVKVTNDVVRHMKNNSVFKSEIIQNSNNMDIVLFVGDY